MTTRVTQKVSSMTRSGEEKGNAGGNGVKYGERPFKTRVMIVP